ncbi:MAG: hypothetical protein ACLGIE_13780 [Alphaproteobacteria bacterium]
MRHDWIFDVLTDLQAYADRNALQELALKLEETLAVARWELGEGTEKPPPLLRARRAH